MTYNSCMNDTKLTIANALLILLKTQPLNKITVTQIRYITVENETYVYITAKDRSVYKQNFADNESLIKIEEGDVITVHYMEGDDGVNTLFSYE